MHVKLADDDVSQTSGKMTSLNHSTKTYSPIIYSNGGFHKWGYPNSSSLLIRIFLRNHKSWEIPISQGLGHPPPLGPTSCSMLSLSIDDAK